MKKVHFICVVLLFLVFSTILTGCKRNNDIKIGTNIFELNKKYKPIFSHGVIYAYELENTYIVIIAKDNKVDKYAVFNTHWELQFTEGLQPVEGSNLEESVGMTLSDVTLKYGPYHADIGSGFYMPTYLLNEGYIAILDVEMDIVTHISVVPIWGQGDGSVVPSPNSQPLIP